MKPKLDPVPIDQMATKRWWVSPHHSFWYYHTPREEVVVPNLDVLEKTLDPCLKELALALNRMGCITLPSCQGMHDNKNNNIKRDNAYDYLLLDMQKIRNEGLVLFDVETGDGLYYYDPHFKLPWDRASFKKRGEKRNNKPQGYLPFLCFNPYVLHTLSDSIAEIPNASLVCNQTHLGLACTLKVYGDTLEQQCFTWNMLGRILCNQ
jgi:hypothetical protein